MSMKWWSYLSIKCRLLTQAITYPWLKLVIFSIITVIMLKTLLLSLTVSRTPILFTFTYILICFFFKMSTWQKHIEQALSYSQWMMPVEWVEKKALERHIQQVSHEDHFLLLIFVQRPLPPAGSCVYWYQLCFRCCGIAYEIYSGGGHIYYVVSYWDWTIIEVARYTGWPSIIVTR